MDHPIVSFLLLGPLSCFLQNLITREKSGQPSRTASLVLGGYDAVRFKPSNVTFSMRRRRKKHDKQIFASMTKLSVIMFTESGLQILDNVIDNSINMFINSGTSYIWLPLSACKKLEKALNITWNEAEQFYLLDESTYANLRK
jgi:hypothetical protein